MKFSTVFLAALGLITSAAAAPGAVTKKSALGEKIKADIEATFRMQFLFPIDLTLHHRHAPRSAHSSGNGMAKMTPLRKKRDPHMSTTEKEKVEAFASLAI